MNRALFSPGELDELQEVRPAEPAPEQGLGTLWQILLQRRRIVLAVLVLTMAAVITVGLLQTPKYTASVVVLVNPGKEKVVNDNQALTDVSPNSAIVDSEMEVLRSPMLAERLVASLKLKADPNWNPAVRPPGPLSDLKKTVKGFFVKPTPPNDDRELTRKVSKAISVSRRGASYVLDVSVQSPNAAQAAQMANELVRLYVGFDDETRVEAGQQATDWLATRVDELRSEVQRKEAAAQEFRSQSGLLTSGGLPLNEQQVAAAQSAALAAKTELAEKEARYRLVQQLIANGGSADTLAAALNSEVIRDLRQQEVEQARKQAELESVLGDLHPSVQSGRKELENIRKMLTQEIARIGTSVSNELDVARARVRTLDANLSAAREQLVASNEATVRLNELERDAAGSRTVYQSFLERYHVISDQGNLANRRVRIIAKANPPINPSSPKLLFVFAIAIAAGIGLGTASGFAADAFDTRLLRPSDVMRRLGMAALVTIPLVRPKDLRILVPMERHPAGYLVERPFSAYAEAFRVMRSTVRFSNPNRKHGVVAVTSSLPDEGKTTCSLSLARIAALAGQSVVLVDCDRRKRSVNELLELRPTVGLLEVLEGRSSWRDAVTSEDPTGVHVLACSASDFTARDSFGTDAMAKLVDELRENYDLVILDCPPVLVVAETRDIVSQADSVILVGRVGTTPARAARAAIEQLRRSDARLLGVALNCFDPREHDGEAYYGARFGSGSSRGYYTG